MRHVHRKHEQTIFHACLDVPPSERDAYLEGACGSDMELRGRVDALLEAHARAAVFTLSPALQQTLSPDLASIGPYRLVRVLGEGGMGTVYEAEQLEPVRRRVAIKILKLGMDTKEYVARFMTERQALAAMDHPYIAKIFDAGQTAAGRPYFIMELVEGMPLLAYCDAHRLSIRERVELLIQICQAVQHAHQKGVLHRDLKPSNILVSFNASTPAPKIIDFGIAKAVGLETLDQITEYTRAGQALGTPAYMSPEQAGFGRLDIDTRTDVYSLGIILYELLAGDLPTDPAILGYAQFLALLERGELAPARPSLCVNRLLGGTETASARSTTINGLRRQLAGDLDWIVMKSLEVERTRRFESVEAFAGDLRRYLDGVPVSAHPPGIAYQLRKFVQRHRVQVAAACAVAFALLSGTIAASIGFVRATRAESAAKQEAAASRQVSDFLVQLFSASDYRKTPGKPPTVRELVERGAADVENLKGQPVVQAKLFGTLTQVYNSLGQYEDSRRFAEKSLALPQSPGREGDLQRANVLFQLGDTLQRLGAIQEARKLYQQALDIRVRILGENHLDVARALNSLGLVDGLMERYDEGAAAHERALAIQQKIGGPFYVDAAVSLRGLAIIQDRRHNIEAGLRLFRSAEEIFEKHYGPDHPITAQALQDVAVSLKDLNRPEEARPLLERSLNILRRAQGPDHPQVSLTEHSLGILFVAQGKLKEALPYLQDAFRIRMTTMGPDNPRTADVAESLATLWVSPGEFERGRALLEQALRAHERSYGPHHFATLETRGNLARALVKANRYDEAITHLRALVQPDVPSAFRANLSDPAFKPLRSKPEFRKLLDGATLAAGR
jgi:non-specific serine/threonine protein kinase/serine/threonine-protein kinase